MKLVELLAKEVAEWQEGAYAYAQDGNRKTYAWTGIPEFDGEDWLIAENAHIHHGENTVLYPPLADDYKTSAVTKAQWQAERDRQKGGEWKRHRGGKCPVKAGTQVSTKHRDGKVVEVHHHTAQTGSSVASLNGVWKHNGDSFDIMSYRVISQPQAEEVEVKDTTIGTLSYKVEIDTTEASQAIDELAAKWDQVDGPLLWRDTVNELDAYIEEFTREREALINRLAEEGFALIEKINLNLDKIDATLDMSDWRNWKAGDIVECTHSGFDKVYTEGKSYCVDHVTNEYAKVADDCGENSFCHINNDEDVKFRLVR